MAAAAAALPPSLRATAVAAAAGNSGTGVSILAGLGGPDADISNSKIPVSVLQSRGVEKPVFMSQLIPAAAAGEGGISEAVATDMGAAGDNAVGANGRQSAAVDAGLPAGSTFWRGFSRTPAAAAATATSDGRFAGSLFGEEVAAEAGPGAVAIGGNQQGLAGASTAAASDGDFVTLLFGTPAPGAAGAKTGFSTPDAAGTGLSTPGGAVVAGFSTPDGQGTGFGMSEEEFGREVLGIQGYKTVERGGNGGTTKRSIKRQRQTPVGYRAGAK